LRLNQKENYISVSLAVLSILVGSLLFLGIQRFESEHELHAQSLSQIQRHDKVVILNFDDGRKTQFTQAKPILDKYGFKATFNVVCDYLDNKKGYMNWKDIETLQKEGHDIASHSMSHAHLEKLSKKGVSFEVAQSKKCLEDHGINVTTFAYPFNEGSSDKNVINIVAKYYGFARTASSPITFLNCDGWKDQSNQKDCTTFTRKGDPTFANRYSIRGWSHDASRQANSYSDSQLLNTFIKIVNSQTKYNKDGIIYAIPIVIYHRAGDSAVVDYNTDLDLFKKEMKYLHDNNFRVLTMKDLRFNETSKDLYIKEFTTPKITMVKAIPNATIKATETTMVKAIPNATIKATETTMVKAISNATIKATETTMVKAISNSTAAEVLIGTPKNITSIASKQSSGSPPHNNATSIEMANKVIDAAVAASQNAHETLTNIPKNITSIASKQSSGSPLHNNATSIEMANKVIDAASIASLNARESRVDSG
jgi:peptidoglycan/xylan/chitin deacetylase (PgdA/CDA1 family)